MRNYFQTKSKTFAMAIQFVTGRNYYKFNDENDTIYSFKCDELFLEKVSKLEELKFN